MIYISGTALAFMRAERERAEIRGAFGLYLSPDQVERIARNPELLQLGGELREITVMFTDVRGFTRISEQFDPHGLTRFMNRFLTPMTDLILAHQRHDRQIHGRRDHGVLECAARCRRATPRAPATRRSPCRRGCVELNVEWKAEAEARGPQHIPVNIGIGLNTGPAIGRQFRLRRSASPIRAWATT